MRNTPKLQDTLEVFLEELETIKMLIETSKGIPDALDQKIEVIKSARLNVDVSKLIEIQKSIENFQTSQFTKSKELNETHLKNLTSIIEANKNNLTTFYLGLIVAALISIISIYFAVDNRMNFKDQVKKNEQLNSFNTDLKNYLIDTKQYKNYNEWLLKKSNNNI